MKKGDEYFPTRARVLNILLADDDKDDCLFFKEALEELQFQGKLTIVHDGQQLMKLLINKSDEPFHILFLDINMPRKNGLECLEEIKSNNILKSLPVIILSTSYDEKIAYQLYKKGAQHYICKPGDFSELKKVILHALILVSGKKTPHPGKNDFLLTNLN